MEESSKLTLIDECPTNRANRIIITKNSVFIKRVENNTSLIPLGPSSEEILIIEKAI